MTMMFAGCLANNPAPLPVAPVVNEVALPDVPKQDQDVCLAPGFKAGQNALTVIKRYQVALIDCSLRHQRVLKFYKKLQEGHAGNAPPAN